MKYKMPVLETKRLVLKRGTLDDYKKVYEYDFTKLRGVNGEVEFVKYDKPEVLELYAKDYDEADNMLDYIMFLKEGNIPIGNIIFDKYDANNKSLEVSYNLHPDYWGNGYVVEALTELMDYAYSNLNIDNVICGYAKENHKSKRVCEKIGFKYYEKVIEHYNSIDKDIEIIKMIMSKENFYSNLKFR